MAGALNKVIEQVAFKQVEEMIVYLELLSEQIISTSKTAKASQISFSSPSKSNDEMNKKLLESQKIIKQLQSDYKKQEEQIRKLSEATVKHTNAVNKLTQEQRNEIINNREIRKELDGNAVATSNLTSYIQKLSVERLRASKIVADYNAQIAIGNALTEEQTAELAQATASFQKYDNAIKAGKKSIGDSREYVGQYERANIGLSNSIGQIARELPAATFGFQTFALGISNNIPIAVDEIKSAIAANKELIAQGKPTVSVWKQVTSALFSFNSVMSIGLLLLALYGKEIGEFFKTLVSGTSSLNDATKSLIEFQNANTKGVINTKNQIQTYKELLNIASNSTEPEKQKIAIDKLRSSYTSWLQALSDEQISKIKGSKIDKEIQKTLGYKEQYEATQNAIQNSNQLIESYKAEIEARQRYSEAIKKQESIRFDSSRSAKEILDAEKTIDALKNQESIRKESIENETIRTAKTSQLLESIASEQEIYNASLGKSQVLKEKSILLDASDNKSKDDKTRIIKENTKANEDYLASEYELLHLRLTNVKNANESIMNDEAMSYDLRLMASEQYYNNLVDLANMEAKEELRVLKFATEDRNRTVKAEYENQKAQLDKYLKDGSITRKQYDNALLDAEKQKTYDLEGIKKDAYNRELIIFENQAQKLNDANLELIGKLQRAWDEINFNKAEINIDTTSLEGVYALGDALDGITENMSIQEIELKLKEINRLSAKYANEEKQRQAQLAFDEAKNSQLRLEANIKEKAINKNLSDEQIKNILINNAEYQQSTLDLIAAERAIAEASNESKNIQINNSKEVKEEQLKAFNQVYDASKALYDALGDFGNQLYENQIANYDRQIEKSNEYFDALIANSEKGSEQERMLLEQKEKAEHEYQRRKIAAQRRQAVFNKIMAVADIIIATAKNIVEAFPNPVLIALAAGLGAVQTATVLAAPLPQYKDGTDYHPGGNAVLGDGGVNEVVQNPDGSIFVTPKVPTIMPLQKGAKVFSSFDDFNKSKLDLENASIMASFANQRTQLQAFDMYVSEFKGISTKIEKGIEKGFKKAKIINNNNMPKFDISHLNYKSKGFNS